MNKDIDTMTERKWNPADEVAVNSKSAIGKDHYLSLFNSYEKSLNGDASSSIHNLRKDAIAKFAELGFPTLRNEEWKYTDVSPIAKSNFQPAFGIPPKRVRKDDLSSFLAKGLDSHLLVFVNGLYDPELSSIHDLPNGVIVTNLAVAIKKDGDYLRQHLGKFVEFDSNSFTALNTAFLHDGAFIVVPDKMIVEKPIHLLFISYGNEEFVSHPRNVVVARKNSQLRVMESFVSLGGSKYFTNAVTEFSLGENAIVDYVKLQRESDEAFHIGSTYTHLERNANFKSTIVAVSSKLNRNNVFATLDGEGAEATLNGLYLGTGSQHIDNHTTIDHAKPHCPSHELYKGILAGKSKGVFNGKIKVRKDAQKTDAKQTNKNLILSDEASIDTKPQLEIYANDVKCTHGATIGQLDDEQLFYLRARGVGLDEARDMLIYAFASDVVDRISIEPLREELQKLVHDRLAEGRK